MRKAAQTNTAWLFQAIHGGGGRVIRVPDAAVGALPTPGAFFQELVRRVGTAKERISVSSLYVGAGEDERSLLRAASASQAASRTTVVMDATRARRLRPSPSPEEFVSHGLPEARLRLLAHPAAAWWPRKHMGRGRLQEGSGTHHAKVYAADGWACAAGANLSEEYFRGRQDRYLVIEDGAMAQVHHSMVGLMADAPAGPLDAAGERARLRDGTAAAIAAVGPTDGDVPVSLAWQCGVLGLRDDEARVMAVLGAVGAGGRIDVATGYCNLPARIVDALAAAARRGAAVRVLTASPAANGFLGARGIPAALPLGYSLLLEAVARRLHGAGVLCDAGAEAGRGPMPGRVRLVEWTHPEDVGWAGGPRSAGIGREPPPEASGRNRRTFHAKGLWVEAEGLLATAAGSSNFGRRSFDIDLELQTWLGPVAADSVAGAVLRRERDALFEGLAAAPVTLADLQASGRRPGPSLADEATGRWVGPAAVLLRPWM